MIRLSIRRPVAVAMVYIAVALLGVSAWRNIPIDQVPDASFPRLTLSFRWAGASPETVEAFATAPIEAAVQQVKWVERITSQSRENGASITVEFAREADMNVVRLDLSERLAVVEESLPDGVGAVTIQPYLPREIQAQASAPVVRYTFTGPYLLEALYAHLERSVAPELIKVPGVDRVNISGGRARLLEIELDPERVAALGLSLGRVSSAIRDLNLVREVGGVRQSDREWTITLRNRPVDIADVRQAVLLTAGGIPVRVDDVATIRDTFEEPTSHHRIDGRPAVSFTVTRARGANTVVVADRIKERIDELQALNPPGSRMQLTFDQSDDIRRNLEDLKTRAFFAAVVIFMVLLLFLRSFRTAAIVFTTIAFSILIALNMVYFSGMSLNLFTLMGLALGFGLIVDNSIVVLENIHRKRQEGLPPELAAEQGARDVVLPILAATLTTLIVFAPFVYFRGEMAIYYMPLAVVVALTLLASLIVAFTFIPALAAKLLRQGRAFGAAQPALATSPAAPPSAGAPSDALPAGALPADALPSAAAGGGASPPAATFGARGNADYHTLLPAYAGRRPPFYIRFYSGLLAVTLRFPWLAVIVAAGCLLGSYHLFDKHVTRGQLWGGFDSTRSWIDIRITLPRGSDLERTDELTRYFEAMLARMPEVSTFITNVSGTSSGVRVEFPEHLELTAVPLVIEEQLRAYSFGFTGASVRVIGQGPAFYGGGGGAAPNYQVTLLGYNFERLADIADDLGMRLAQHSRVREVDTNASGGGRHRDWEFVVSIDRDAASRHELTMLDVARLVTASVRSQASGGAVMIGGEEVDFQVKLTGFERMDVLGLVDHVVRTPRNTEVRLGDIIAIDQRRVMTTILREDQQYERTVAYEFRGPHQFGNVINQAAIEATVLPPGYTVRDRTPWRMSSDDRRQLRLAMLMAVGLIFMVTAGIFESIRQPLVVLLAVPMALIGVFLIFFYAGAPFNREAEIGVIMMGGIVVNNAILLVDHINRIRRETTLTLELAVIRGTLERVRPILMTTATTVLGLLPLVLFTRTASATIWTALTYSLIGGLLASTLFVLTTTPSLYLLFERMGRRQESEVPAPEAAAGAVGVAGAGAR